MPAKIVTALVTAAGPAQRRLPLQQLAHHDGAPRAAIAILLDELLAAGIERVGLVLAPGDRAAYESVLAPYGAAVTYLEQAEPAGYGHAVWCGRAFTGDAPFLLQVSDHLYVSRSARSCTRQLLDLAEAEDCAVSAVQATHEGQLQYYGTVGAALVPGRRGLYTIERVLEKPTPTVAEQLAHVPGLRAGTYLCFFGMHVLGPAIYDLLERQRAAAAPGANLGLSPALDALAARSRYLAAEIDGRRANLEAHFGLLRAQVALGLAGAHRAEVLSLLAEELALAATEPPRG